MINRNQPKSIQDVQYLAFAPGAARAIYAYAGALQHLETREDYSSKNIQGAFGASAGAQSALTFCLNYTDEDMRHHLTKLDITAWEGKRSFLWSAFNFLHRFGTHDNSGLRTSIEAIIEQKTGYKDITFNQIKQLTGKDLYVVTATISKIGNRYEIVPYTFSPYNSGETSVVSAVLASSSLPTYFPYLRLKNTDNDYKKIESRKGDIYFDPAWFPSMDPIKIAIKEIQKREEEAQNTSRTSCPSVLGFRIQPSKNKTTTKKENISDYQPFIMVSALKYKLQNELLNYTLKLKEDSKTTINIDPQKISIANFWLNTSQKTTLFQSGANAAHKFFNPSTPHNHVVPINPPEFKQPKKQPSPDTILKMVAAGAMGFFSARNSRSILSVAKRGIGVATLGYLAIDAIVDEYRNRKP